MYLANLIPVFASAVSAVGIQRTQSDVPDYFISSPEAFAGPTATESPPFLAQSNPAPFSASYIAPQPLETQVPIEGAPPGGNIYHLQGQLSHYFPNPRGFGVSEYPLPAGAETTQLHVVQRHGSRYTLGTQRPAPLLCWENLLTTLGSSKEQAKEELLHPDPMTR